MCYLFKKFVFSMSPRKSSWMQNFTFWKKKTDGCFNKPVPNVFKLKSEYLKNDVIHSQCHI